MPVRHLAFFRVRTDPAADAYVTAIERASQYEAVVPFCYQRAHFCLRQLGQLTPLSARSPRPWSMLDRIPAGLPAILADIRTRLQDFSVPGFGDTTGN